MKNPQKSLIILLFVGYLIITGIFIFVLTRNDQSIKALDQKIYKQVTQHLVEDKDVYETQSEHIDKDEHIQEIIRVYHQEQKNIEKKSLASGISGFTIALGLLLTRMNGIIKTVREMIKEWKGEHEVDVLKTMQEEDIKKILQHNCEEEVKKMVQCNCNVEENPKEEKMYKDMVGIFMKQYAQLIEESIEKRNDRHKKEDES